MHNLKPSSKDPFIIYKETVARKWNGADKSLLTSNESTVEKCYMEYNDSFIANTLASVCPHKMAEELKTVLFDMYSFSSKVVREIRGEIINNNSPSVSGFCQNCGLTHANTMDHYLPHERFPEYSIHAKNLIPCCSECNENKGNGEILNMYLDKLPEVEYLFMDVDWDNDTLLLSFRLENKGNKVESGLFDRITNHFERLKLFSRMKDEAIRALPRFESDLKFNYIKLGKDSVIEISEETIDDMREAYGYNYWEVAFRKGLIESDIFWAYYKERIDRKLV